MKKQTSLEKIKFVIISIVMLCTLLYLQTQSVIANPNQKESIFIEEYVQDSVLFTGFEGNTPLFTDHAPIYIDSDSGFWEFPGLGTADQPYVIENLRIQPGPEGGDTLSIFDTTAHFIIRNCIFENTDNSGISLRNIAPYTGIIENNTVRNCKFMCIFCGESEGVEIVNNIIKNSSGSGIHLEMCSKSEISGNFVKECVSGIIYSACDEMKAHHNTIESMENDGIYQDGGLTNSIVYANNITECGNMGMAFYGSLNNCNFTGNIITECYQNGLHCREGYGVKISNNIIENCSSNGVYLEYCRHFEINENNISDCVDGIWLYNTVNYNNFTKNIISNCSQSGMYLYDAQHCKITSNILTNNTMYGISLTISQDNLIYFNDIYGNVNDQAYEGVRCDRNRWDNGTFGNYWGDSYLESYPDAQPKSENCWNTSYDISGTPDGVDNFPLLHSITLEFEKVEETTTSTATTTTTTTTTITTTTSTTTTTPSPPAGFISGYSRGFLTGILIIMAMLFVYRKKGEITYRLK